MFLILSNIFIPNSSKKHNFYTKITFQNTLTHAENKKKEGSLQKIEEYAGSSAVEDPNEQE